MKILANKTILITGGSRGIGQAIGLRLASEGANIAIVAKEEPDIDLAAVVKEFISVGGKAVALTLDISDAAAIKQAVAETVKHFGGIDVLINNTSATCFTNTESTTPKQFDFLIATSVRVAFFMAQACLPYLKNAKNPHIVNISPPLTLQSKWFKDHLAFSLGKYAMSMCTLGMAEEFKEFGIAVNSLWPQTTIATQSIKNHFSDEVYKSSRWPTIMAAAAFELIKRKANECTGNFFTDEKLLREAGQNDFSQYAVVPDATLLEALYISEPSLNKKNKTRALTQDMFLDKNN